MCVCVEHAMRQVLLGIILEMFALTKQQSPRDSHLTVFCPREAQHTSNGILVLFLFLYFFLF